MKKLSIVLITLLVLTACSSNHYSTVSDADEVLFECPDGSAYTKGEVYDYVKKFDITTSVTNSLVLKLCDLEDIDTSGLQAEAEAEIAEAEEMGYASYITYYYGSNEAYISSYISYSAMNKLKAKYINNDLAKYVEEYTPFKAEVVYFDDEEAANKVVEETAKAEETFAYICSENGYADVIEETVYTKDSSLPEEVLSYIDSANAGLSDVIKVEEVSTDSDGNSSTTTLYYLVNLISKDANDFLDDFTTAIASDIEDDEAIAYFLSNHSLEIHDQDIYDILVEKYEVLK